MFPTQELNLGLLHWSRFFPIWAIRRVSEIIKNVSFTFYPLLKEVISMYECKYMLRFCGCLVFQFFSNSLQLHGLQDARLPCPSPSPGASSNSCTFIRWCHPTISSSVNPFSSCLQSFPASGSFLNNWVFTSGCQRIGASTSESVLLINFQSWSLGLSGLISLKSKDYQDSSPTLQFKSINSSAVLYGLLYGPTLTSIHDYWKNKKQKTTNIALTIWTFVGKVMSLFFNMLSRFVTGFLPRSVF